MWPPGATDLLSYAYPWLATGRAVQGRARAPTQGQSLREEEVAVPTRSRPV